MSDDRFARLLAKHEPELRAFIRASLPSSHDVAEVIQNVSLVAWKKFSEPENAESEFARLVWVIARFEITAVQTSFDVALAKAQRFKFGCF